MTSHEYLHLARTLSHTKAMLMTLALVIDGNEAQKDLAFAINQEANKLAAMVDDFTGRAEDAQRDELCRLVQRRQDGEAYQPPLDIAL